MKTSPRPARPRSGPSMDLQQGDCIRLPALNLEPDNLTGEAAAAIGAAGTVASGELMAGGESPDGQLYQVVSVDAPGDRCWLRRWPLARHGSPVFELSLRQLQSRQPHRPHLRGPS
ncbi:MAG: hypothetical protein VKO65_00605 [Cyanobacteriota bacterium]|nr:hypothetical protein [Cyanobacteriota bacterium]